MKCYYAGDVDKKKLRKITKTTLTTVTLFYNNFNENRLLDLESWYEQTHTHMMIT